MIEDEDTSGGTTASFVGDDAPEPAPAWCRLHIVHPPALAAEHTATRTEVVLGRDPGRDGIELRHPTVSRRHAELRADPRTGAWSAVDLGAHNGSWVDGSPLGAVDRALGEQAVVRLGEIVLVFEAGRGPADAPQPAPTDAVPGASRAAAMLRASVAAAAANPSAVLVMGESGTGKEFVVRALHEQSRRPGPLVVTNCAALSPALIEGQLFGHEKGAYTGAVASQPGMFRAAEGGTLFMDEIGELPLELQPKLLRAVELREVTPLGATSARAVDVRIVAATNRELSKEVERGTFRRDLNARLSLQRIRAPALRDRKADIMSWVDRLARRRADVRGEHWQPPRFSPEAVEAILLHPWDENLRGLDHLVHALPGGASTVVKRASLPPELQRATPTEPAPHPDPDPDPDPEPAEQLRRPRPTRSELLVALDEHGWNMSAVARYYGRGRRQVYRWLELFGIERKQGS